MKPIALVIIAASLGYVAGQKTPAEDVAVVVPAVVTPAANDNTPDVIVPPVETPLVDKMLPKPVQAPKPTIADGQISPGGNFRYEAARNIFVPIDKGHPRYDYNDAPVTLEHLIAAHGHARHSASKWTREEIEIAHANSHYQEKMNAARAAAPVRASGCPGGVCPSPSRGGLFRRR
jgi:hypothetical protein